MFWKKSGPDNTPRCSFCQKWEASTGEMIASPSNEDIFICAECVAVCNSILTDRLELSRQSVKE